MNSPQDIPQPKVFIDEVHPQHTFSLRRSNIVYNIPLRYGFIIKNNNEIHIIEDDDPLTYLEAVMSKDFDK